MQDGSSLFFNWCSTGTYSASYLMIFSPDKNLPQKGIKQIVFCGRFRIWAYFERSAKRYICHITDIKYPEAAKGASRKSSQRRPCFLFQLRLFVKRLHDFTHSIRPCDFQQNIADIDIPVVGRRSPHRRIDNDFFLPRLAGNKYPCRLKADRIPG